jgi:hypothetical protein
MEVTSLLHAPAALLPGEMVPRYQLDRSLDESQGRSGHYILDISIFLLLGIEC